MRDADHMPADLRAVLSDPGIVIRQDAAVFELIARWKRAPSASAAASPEVGHDVDLLEHLARQAAASRSVTGVDY
jgi:hypothetical protein